MRRILLLIFSTVLITAAAASIRQQQIGGRSCCNLYDLLTANGFWMHLNPKYSLAKKQSVQLHFERNQRRYTLNGSRVELCFPLADSGGMPYLSVMDWQKSMRPLLYPATVPKHRVYTVFLDMGHGGNDPGASGAFSREKNITLTLGRKVAAMLRSYGFRVVMSRNRDVQIPLYRVGALQRQSRSDIFVSIHVNSAADRKISGIETFCLTPAGAASSNGGKVDKQSLPGNRFDANNIFLAWHIQQNLLKYTSATDRGVKRARFAVLKELSAPGVLVEVGFISNRAEEKKLNQRAYQDKIAAGITAGIVSYTRSLRKKP